MSDADIARLPDPPEPNRGPKRLQLRVEALEGLAIGVPSRVKTLMESEDRALQPGACQSDHPLSPVLDSMGGVDRADQMTLDPTFPRNNSLVDQE
jgi:hypothetical protein